MLNQAQLWIEFTFSNLSVSELGDCVPEFLAVLWICMDGKSTVCDGWFLKSSWKFFPRCFEIFCLCRIVLYEAINCT